MATLIASQLSKDGDINNVFYFQKAFIDLSLGITLLALLALSVGFVFKANTIYATGITSSDHFLNPGHQVLPANEFENTTERLPRVRFGQVHVYDNYYNEAQNPSFLYALGVGVSSQIYAQNNYYRLPSTLLAGNIIGYYKGTAIHTEGDLVNGKPVDLLAAYNAINTPTLSGDVGWTPQYYLHIDPTQIVPLLVELYAGTGRPLTGNV